MPVPGRKWAGTQGTKPRQGAPSAVAGLPGQGQVRGFSSGQLAPSQSFLPILQRTRGRKRGCPEGRTTLGTGSPLHRIQTSLGRKMLPGALEGTEKHRVLGSLPKPKFAPQANAVGGETGGEKHMEKPASSTLPGEAAAPPQPAVPFPFCSLRCLPGTVTRVSTAWL